MPGCQKCWNDAGLRAASAMRSKAECYEEIMNERKDSPCSPEQQAGIRAGTCKKCKRETMHEINKMCMNPNCS